MLFSSKLRGRRVDWIILVVVVVAVLLVGGAWLRRPPPFDPRLWSVGAGNDTPGNPRWGMRSEALRMVRVGMSKDDVRAKLGEPDRFEMPGWLPRDMNRDFFYIVGAPNRNSREVVGIQVAFGPTGRVLNVALTIRDSKYLRRTVP